MLRVSIVKTDGFNIDSVTPIAIIEDETKLDIIHKYLRSEFKLWFSTKALIGTINNKTGFLCTNNKEYVLRVEIINEGIYFLGS